MLSQRKGTLSAAVNGGFGPSLSWVGRELRENAATDLMAARSPFYRMLRGTRVSALTVATVYHE